MLWSNFDMNGYSVQIAYSSNGRIDGAWRQQSSALFTKTKRHDDGGHGMLFTAPDGQLTLSLHSPNFVTEENPTTALLVPVVDIGDTLVSQERDNVFEILFYRIYYLFNGLKWKNARL